MADTLGNDLFEQLATKDDIGNADTRLEGTSTLMKRMLGFALAFVVAIA